jgi:hypothetical protein
MRIRKAAVLRHMRLHHLHRSRLLLLPYSLQLHEHAGALISRSQRVRALSRWIDLVLSSNARQFFWPLA